MASICTACGHVPVISGEVQVNMQLDYELLSGYVRCACQLHAAAVPLCMAWMGALLQRRSCQQLIQRAACDVCALCNVMYLSYI